jgi:hypothetical protein
MFMSTGGESIRLFSKDFFRRGGTFEQSFSGLQQAIQPAFIEATKSMQQFGSDMGGLDLRSLMMLTGGKNAERFDKLLARMTDQQYKQITGVDRATAAQAKARDSQIKGAQNLQEFVKLGVAPATQALAYFTEAIEYLTDFIPGAGSAKKRRAEEQAIREGRETATTRAQSAYQTGTESMGYEMGGAGFEPSEESAPGTAPATTPGVAPSTAPATTPGVAPSTAPATTPGAGLTGKPLSGISPALAQAMQLAATEYNQITGKNVEVTSARRDRAKQAELYQAFKEGRSRFPASPPGNSKHELGHAIDIAEATAEQMDRMGLLHKYGLSRPVRNDPVHIEASAELGGILSGPKSGYQAMLHGTEAVVPLPNGRNIPVEVRNQDSGMMSAQLDKLDELVRVMQNQLSISTKILQATN